MKAITASVMAGLGGLLPSACKIAVALTTDPSQPLPHPHIFIGLGVFFLISLVLNVGINRDHHLDRAVMIGICAPGIITNAVAGYASSSHPTADVPSPPAHVEQSGSLLDPLLGYSARADDTNSSYGNVLSVKDVLSDQDILKLSQEPSNHAALVKVIGPDGKYTTSLDSKLDVQFFDHGVMVKNLFVQPGQSELITPPTGATELSFGAINSHSRGSDKLTLWSHGLPGKFVVLVDSREAASGWSDFWWVLGADRKIVLQPRKTTVYRLVDGQLVPYVQ
ncbi:MAG: hypothetical protein E6Q98_15040 [Rhodospirillaceae bacterium]|nr:MAG: hypothetical protein E6Q98_15040 [Rhodospirillaceae bacterium]